MVVDLTGGCCKRNSRLLRSHTGSKSSIKIKLFNLVTFCLATSSLLAPAQAAFGNSTQEQTNLGQPQYLVCVKQGEHFLCDIEKSSDRDSPRHSFVLRESARNQATTNNPKSTDSLNKSSTISVMPQLLSPTQQGTITNILLGLSFVILPFGFGLAIFLYDKYTAYRSAVLKEQIEMLERLWEQSTQP